MIGSVILRTAAGLCGAAALLSTALAGTIESAYTPLVLEDCQNATPREMADQGAIFRCQGYGGIDVRVVEGDLRMYVSFGEGADDQTAAGQTIPAFNTTGETLEWRLSDGTPFATILRLRWDSDGRKGSTLVVTKLGATDACHVAYVKAERNPDANELAREIADKDARRFSCERDRARTYGADGSPID